MFVCGKNKERISYALLRVAWKLFYSDKKNDFYGTDKRLYEAEIHMIMHIKDNPGMHVSALAEKIGVTKGAVSQTVMKLERKGMVIKEKASDNQAKTLLCLTPKGEVAYGEHRKFHREFDREVEQLLGDASPAQRAFLQEFLAKIEGLIEK